MARVSGDIKHVVCCILKLEQTSAESISPNSPLRAHGISVGLRKLFYTRLHPFLIIIGANFPATLKAHFLMVRIL